MAKTQGPDGEFDKRQITDALLEIVTAAGYRPAKPRVLAQRLGVAKAFGRDFKKLVKELVKAGRLAYGSQHLIETQGAKSDRLVGIYRRKPEGYGFVTPRGAEPRDEVSQDIYIAPDMSRDAANGDTVAVRVRKARGRRGLRQGEIIEIIERETHQFVGTYFEAAGSGFVQVDGGLFTQAILVGDPGAKGAKAGDKVVFEMARFPTHIHDGEGVLTEVLGPAGAPGVDTLAIVREFNLPDEFAEDALEEAREQTEAFDETIAPGRRDFTSETVITIDPEDARDFDDAISLTRSKNGHWLLGVHIADVSHFVRPRTALDREARARATSVYLPDRVLPMLPELISNGLASLQPERVRYTKTALIELTADGALVGADLVSGAIRSARRFTYEEVDSFLADRAAWKKKLKPDVFALLARMHELAMMLRRRRFVRGSLELSMPEVRVTLDRDGRVTGAQRVAHTESHQIIEEFMLAANEAVAQTLHEKEVAFLRRVHGAPEPRKLKALTEFVKELGYDVASLESRFELQSLLDRVQGEPAEYAVNYAVLRSMQRAIYSPEEEGHYALASECYCHFTSPIRRYPDLTVHRLIDVLAAGTHPEQHFGELLTLGEHCSQRERRAEAAERELTKIKLLHYLADRIGDEMEAVVTGVEQFGLFVQGVHLPAEGLIHISSLDDDYYNFDRTTRALVGHRAGNEYRLGDALRVVVAHVDLERRELDFRCVGRISLPTKKRRGSKRPPRGSSSASKRTTAAKKKGAAKKKAGRVKRKAVKKRKKRR